MLKRTSLPILVLISVAACSKGGAEAARPELLISAATSTRDALLGLKPAFERDHAAHLVFNFGSSSDLANQILAAPRADVFLSADEKEMDRLEQAHLLVAGSRQALLSNQLVVIEPSDQPTAFTAPFNPAQLAAPAIRLLSLGDPASVPAGRYAKVWLEKTGVWSRVSDRILPGIDVRAALAAVESGGAQAGIVYRTDVVRSKRARVAHEIPRDEGPRITYPVAAISGRPHESEARALLSFLASPEARQAFESAGFVILPR